MPEPSVKHVLVERLTRDAFASYGVLIRAGDPDGPDLNRAPGQMAFMWVHRNLEYPKQPFIATGRYYYRGCRCDYLQRHPKSTTVLIPMGSPHASVIIVADDDGHGLPDIGRAHAFFLDGSQGLVVHPGVWIRYAYPITDFADFAYVSSRIDPEDDIERINLEDSLGVDLEFMFGPPEGEGVQLSRGGAVLKLPTKSKAAR